MNRSRLRTICTGLRPVPRLIGRLGLLAMCACVALPLRGQRPPNVVLVMMDDLGYGDLGSYGAPDVRTPNIDRLAREGVRFTDAYAASPVCSPTRAALISGHYPQREGLESALAIAPDRDRGLVARGASLPSLLRAAGYRTALFGKWHLGWKPEFRPLAHGFDQFYGFLSGAHSYHTNRAEVFRAGAGPADLFENDAPVQATGYLTDEISRRAVRFIAQHADQPFFVEVAYNAVHWPFEPPDRPPTDTTPGASRSLRQMPDEPTPATRADYVRMLERADRGVGEILAALDAAGLSRNTLVIFTNDNGGEWLSRNAPLFHRKYTLWEGGIRVPLIMRWPERIPPRQTSPQVAITMDVSATILSATAAVTPPGTRIDGIDLLPVARRAVPVQERRLFWRYAGPDRQQRAARSGRWKLVVDAGQSLLFDLAVDPGERTDLAGRRPDLVASLKAMVAAWEADVTAPAAPSR
jgi:arylsulfatase A